MDLKKTQTKFKLIKKAHKKKKNQTHKPSRELLTEPNEVDKYIPTYSDLLTLQTEPAFDDDYCEKDHMQEREAYALDYLRALSEEESDFGISYEINRLEASDTSSQRISRAKKQKKSRILDANNRFVTRDSAILNKNKGETRNMSRKRIRSEPNIGSSNQFRSKSCQVLDTEVSPRHDTSKMDLETSLLGQNIVTERSHQDYPTNNAENRIAEEINMLPILQIRRIVGNKYPCIMQEIKTIKDIRSFFKDKTSNQILSKGAYRKALNPTERKFSTRLSHSQTGTDDIMLLGRSLSLSKIHLEHENLVDKNMTAQQLPTEDSKYGQETRILSHRLDKNNNQTSSLINSSKGIRLIASARTSRQNIRRHSFVDINKIRKREEITKRECKPASMDLDNLTTFYNQTEIPHNPPTASIERSNSKDMKEIKVGFWLKAKKNVINPTPTENEVSLHEKIPLQSKIHRIKRETSKENKAFLDKVSKVYGFKMANIKINKQKDPLEGTLSTEFSEASKIMLKLKEANLNKEQRPYTSISTSKRESFSKIDMKTFLGNNLRLKTVLNFGNQNIKTEGSQDTTKDSLKDVRSLKVFDLVKQGANRIDYTLEQLKSKNDHLRR